MRPPRPLIIIAAVGALAIGGMTISGLVERSGTARGDPDDRPLATPHRVTAANGERVIRLDTKAQRVDGIRTLLLKNEPHRRELRAYGRVLDLEPLTEMANRYADAKARLTTARAKLAASQTAFARARKLYGDRQNISAAELQSAEAAFRVDEAGLASADSQLRTTAVAAQQRWGTVLSEALVDATPLFTRLLARQEILLQITLRPGQEVAEPATGASVALNDGSRKPLRFISPATRTDPRIQGASFYFTAPGESGLLPGMSVMAFLTGGPTVEGVVVPASAVVWGEGRAWAYFRTSPDSFARRAVATDMPTRDGSYLVRGLPDNAVVVVQGAQMLFSEELRAPLRGGDED
jgi:multidrug efflux pump subunit AcrA (membrane-fusion protein)